MQVKDSRKLRNRIWLLWEEIRCPFSTGHNNLYKSEFDTVPSKDFGLGLTLTIILNQVQCRLWNYNVEIRVTINLSNIIFDTIYLHMSFQDKATIW